MMNYFKSRNIFILKYTRLHSKDNEAARRGRRGVYFNTLRKPTTMPTKLAKECDWYKHLFPTCLNILFMIEKSCITICYMSN